MKNVFDISGTQQAITRTLKSLPHLMANESEKFFKDSFRKKGFTNIALIKWKEVKYENPKGSLMNRDGHLKMSIKVHSVFNNGYIITAGDSKVKYAKIHNEGGTINTTVTPQMRKWAWAQYRKTKDDMFRGIALTKKGTISINIPQRKFMGNSFTLDRIINKLIDREINKVLNKL